MQHLQPNTTLQGGKYRIDRVLGQGGFGITYLAVQTSLQRQVAIKEFFMKDFCSRDEATLTMLTPSVSSKQVEQYRKKFIKEARNLARLNHPNIISVIDVFEENGTVYYAMPYLVGGSLQDYVKAHGTLSETVAMKYVIQIASALKYMHEEEHICHYDVKPANILLDDKGNAVLIDFGISKNYDSAGHETTTTPVGMSDGYAPIEQYSNMAEFSPTSDVYALGATLYFLLHGKRPVKATDRASGTALLMSKQLSQGIKDIINASMKVSKRERANSMDVFLKEGFFSGQKTSSYDNSLADDEETIIDRSRINEETSISVSHTNRTASSVSTSSPQDGNASYVKWIVVIGIATIIGLVIWFFNNNSSQTSQTPTANNDTITMAVSKNKPFVLKGKIADNIAFTMHLSVNGNIIEGTEHYDNQKKDAIVQIRGTLENNGEMILNEYDGNIRTGSYKGLFGADSYSGTFTNGKGKEFGFSSTVMDEETFEEWSNTQFETSLFNYRKNSDGIIVELKADYPIRGNEELLGKTRLFVAGAIEKLFDINTKVADLQDGQALLNHSGVIKFDDMKKEKYGEDGSSNEYEETVNIQKSFENDKCVSFCASSFYCHGGVGNSFRIGATFRKEDGNQIVVLKNTINTDLRLMVIQAVKSKLGSDYELVDTEKFESSPLPSELPHLTKSGVQFDYQHYEIGAGALGQISVIIPYNRIKTYMSDEAKQLVY